MTAPTRILITVASHEDGTRCGECPQQNANINAYSGCPWQIRTKFDGGDGGTCYLLPHEYLRGPLCLAAQSAAAALHEEGRIVGLQRMRGAMVKRRKRNLSRMEALTSGKTAYGWTEQNYADAAGEDTYVIGVIERMIGANNRIMTGGAK